MVICSLERKKKRIPLIVKIVVAAVAVYCIVTFATLQRQIQISRDENVVLDQTVQEQRQKNAALEEAAETELDNSVIAQMAREKLGLIFPGETVYYDVSN